MKNAKSTIFIVIIFLSFPLILTAQSKIKKYEPVRDTAFVEKIPFDRYSTRDKFDREIVFYLSKSKDEKAMLPLALLIQGSGCASLFFKAGDQIAGGQQYLLMQAAARRARILIVEKPGVKFLDSSKQPGTAEGCPADFLREHTLERWAEAVNAVLEATLKLKTTDTNKILVIGHSEGGIVAAKAAADNPKITHVASLAGGGPTQLFDLAETVRRSQPNNGDSTQDAAQQIYAEWKKITADPDSTEKFFFGHPYKRWSSFLKSSTLEELLRGRAKIYLAQGTGDQVESPAGFDAAVAQLLAKGRDVTFERVENADHSFSRKPGDFSGLVNVFSHVMDWFLRKAA